MAPPPRLVIESGVHRGAHCDIPQGLTSVGAGFDNSVSLSDLAAVCAFEIECSETKLMLRARATDVKIAGKSLPPGRMRQSRESFAFTSDGIEFHLDIPSGLFRTSAFRPHALAYGWIFLAGAVATGTLAISLHAGPSHIPSPLGLSLESTGSIPTAPAAIVVGPGPSASVAKVLDELRGKLSTAGMDMVTVRLRRDGSIAAKGRISQAQTAAWRAIGHWFDSAAKGRYVLVDDLEIMPDAPPLTIEAVWSGSNPYVVDGDGQKFFVGSILPSGWRIRRIDRNRVLIEHGRQMVAVRF